MPPRAMLSFFVLRFIRQHHTRAPVAPARHWPFAASAIDGGQSLGLPDKTEDTTTEGGRAGRPVQSIRSECFCSDCARASQIDLEQLPGSE
jgi:hypothetical protein